MRADQRLEGHARARLHQLRAAPSGAQRLVVVVGEGHAEQLREEAGQEAQRLREPEVHVLLHLADLLVGALTVVDAHPRAERAAEAREARALAHRIAPHDQHLGRQAARLEAREQLVADAALADPGGTRDDRGARRALVEQLLVDADEQRELLVAAHGGRGPSEQDAAAEPARVLAHEDGAEGVFLEHEAPRERAEHTRIDAGGASLARFELLGGALERLRREAGGAGLRAATGGDGVTDRDHRLRLRQRLRHQQRGARRADRLVADGARQAEHRHDAPAEQRLDPRVFAEDLPELLVQRRIEPRRAQIEEGGRDDPTLGLALRPLGLRRRRLRLRFARRRGAPDRGRRAVGRGRIVREIADAREGAGELARVLEAILLATLDRLQHGAIEQLGDIEADAGWARRILDHQPPQERDDVIGLEHVAAGEQLEQRRAERVDIGARVDLFAARLLGGHEMGRAQDRAPVFDEVLARHAHDAKVDQLDVGALAPDEEDVSELQIAVDDAPRVHRGHRLRRAPHDLDGVLHAERGVTLTLDQILSVEPLHRVERPAIGERPVRDVLDDVGVPQVRDDRDLALEARALHHARARAQDLDRDHRAGLTVGRTIHVAHAPAACAALEHETIRLLIELRKSHEERLAYRKTLSASLS